MQSIFKRYENKYLITFDQFAAVWKTLPRYMAPDQYGEYIIQNLYYDTDGWDVARASADKPLYKEKLRLRCYGKLAQDSVLFLELKKKYNGVVYKRRLPISMSALSRRTVQDAISLTIIQGAARSISGGSPQIARELDYYLSNNAVYEKIYISHNRKAYVGKDDPDLRVTFDTDVHFRLDNLHFTLPGDGRLILPRGIILMEIKTPGGMPVWLARLLSDNNIFPSVFSKFGACYSGYILNTAESERRAPASA